MTEYVRKMRNDMIKEMQAAGSLMRRDEISMERDVRIRLEEVWLERIWRKFIVKECRTEARRTGLLCEILFGNAGRTRDELAGQIYLYGSMLKEKDLMARQLFLWLLEMLEEDRHTGAVK